MINSGRRLASYCCEQLSGLKQNKFVSLYFPWIRNLSTAHWVPLRVSRGSNQSMLHSSSEAGGPLPGSFRLLAESSPLGSRRTEFPIFLLAVRWGSRSAPRGHWPCLPYGPHRSLQHGGWLFSRPAGVHPSDLPPRPVKKALCL